MKWEHINPKSVGHRESIPMRKIHSIVGLCQERRKISSKQFNFTLRETRKETPINKAKSKYMEGNNKVRAEINKITS